MKKLCILALSIFIISNVYAQSITINGEVPSYATATGVLWKGLSPTQKEQLIKDILVDINELAFIVHNITSNIDPDSVNIKWVHQDVNLVVTMTKTPLEKVYIFKLVLESVLYLK